MSSPGEVEVPADDGDPFVKRVALSVAVFAVVLALAASGGNNAGKEMLMGQMKASNEWSRYQAKVQREVLLTQEREQLEQVHGPLDKAAVDGLAKEYADAQKDEAKRSADPAVRGKRRLAHVTTKLAEYEKDKKELFDTARGYEAERDTANRRDPYFDAAELLLQIGIVLASVAMLSKTRWAFVAAVVLAAVGGLLTLNGYLLVVEVPFLSGGGPTPAAG